MPQARATRPAAGGPDVSAGPPGLLPRARRVLLLVDFVNPLDFDGAAQLAAPALAAARRVAALRDRLGGQGVPAIYVNDNFSRWRSDFLHLVARCRAQGGDARRLVHTLRPGAGDLAVLKPRHSAFFDTPLDLLLRQIGAREVIVTGLATDRCVMLSAADAFMRGYRLWVPQDCCAAESPQRHAQALAWMRDTLRARTRDAAA